MYRTLPHSQPIGLVQSAYVTSLLRGDCTKLVQHQHIVLYERQNAAASLGMHMYGFRVVLKDTFAPGDLDTVINQLVFRGHGDLEQFVDDRDLFVRVVGEIMDEFNMQQPTEADTIGDVENKWPRASDFLPTYVMPIQVLNWDSVSFWIAFCLSHCVPI